MLNSILGLIIHGGVLKGYKKYLALGLFLAQSYVPERFQPIVQVVAELFAAWGITSDFADKSKIIPAFKD